MLLHLSHPPPLYLPPPCILRSTSIPPSLSSYPWVIHVSSLASTFPILFLTSPCLFCTYHLCFLFPVPFPSFSPFSLPADNLHIDDSVPVPVVCVVCFFLGSVDICEFIVILMFIVLNFFFFLDKSLYHFI